VKKFLGILILGFLLSTTSFAGVKKGKGEVKMSEQSVDWFIQYIRGKKQRNPAGFILSSDGRWANYHYCPMMKTCRASMFHVTIKKCEEQTGLECGLFARRYTILWKNGINPGKGKASTIRKKWSDAEIRAKLTELGFLGGGSLSNKTITPKSSKKIDSKKYTNGLVYFGKCSWSLDEKDYYNSFEVDITKKTIEEEFFAEGEIFKGQLNIILNNDDFIKTKIEEYGDSYNQYVFNKKNDEITSIFYKDKKGNVLEDKYLLFCKDIFGTLNNQKIKKKVTKKNEDIVNKLKDLKELLDTGVLSKEEFEKAKKKLLN